jgi:NifU-like protein involved in Fe-S cluster formation
VAAGVTDAPYTRDILRLAADVPYREGFSFAGVERVSRTCGSRARVAVTLDEAGRVATIRQAIEACAYGQAAAALMGAAAIGKSGDEVAAALAGLAAWLGGRDDTASTIWIGLDALAPALDRSGRHGAIMLPFQTLKAAIDEAAQ